MKKYLFLSLILFILISVCQHQAVAGTPTNPFLPKGEWETPGGALSMDFSLEQGKIQWVEEGDSSEGNYRIIRQSPWMLSIMPHTPERDARVGDEVMFHPRSIKEFIRLGDNALVYAGGCIGGFLMLRKEAGLSLSKKSHATGRWGFPDGEGGWEIVIDFDRKVESGYKSGPFDFTEPSPGEVLISVDGQEMTARWFGNDIMGIYSQELPGNFPPFGFARIE